MGIEELQSRFGITGVLRFELDEHGMERAMIKTPAAEAIVYLQGAHITHYQPAGQKPVLFLSSKSHFAPGKAIRGGIPIIYPWFGAKQDDPKAPMHGYARTSAWQVDFGRVNSDVVELGLTLDSPGHSNVRLLVQIGSQLDLELQVSSRSEGPITIEEAFHSYLAIADVRHSFVVGLGGRTFIDKTDQMQRKMEPQPLLAFKSETDRVYLNTERACDVFDLYGKRRITIAKSNSASTVVWNPWEEKSRGMFDMGAGDWQRMLCIETANAADNAITLAPGATHRMSASIRAETFDLVAVLEDLQQEKMQQRRAG